jgi:CD109 antigen
MICRFYTVVAPRVLRPNSEYHVSVSTHGVDRTTQVTVDVGGRQDSGNQFTAGQSASVEPRTTRIIKIDVIKKIHCNLDIRFFV